MSHAQAGRDDRSPASASPRPPASLRPGLIGPRVRFAAGSAVALALFAGTYIALVATEPGQRIENLALRGAELRGPNERQAALDVLSVVTAAILALSAAGIFVAGLVLRRPGLGCAVVAVMAVSVVGAELLKEVLERPELVPGPRWLLRNSFPSGTATVATSMALGAYMIAPNRVRWLLLPLGSLFAGIVAHAVQASGWHRMSDTIGATALVICIACVGLVGIASAGLVHPSSGGLIDRRVKRLLVVGSIATLMVGVTLLALPAAFPLLAAPDGARRAFLQVALPLVGGSVTVLLVTLFGLLIEPFSLGRSSAQPATTSAPDQAADARADQSPARGDGSADGAPGDRLGARSGSRRT